MTDQIRIQLLGDFSVRRLDGSTVGSHEWRTGKTMDLLRLLAIDNGRPVRIASLLARLWPDVSDARAKASLRTAASQIRRAVGTNCVARQPGNLLLTDCWVDVGEFLSIHAAVQRAALQHEPADVLHQAKLAERLYRDDFHAYDDDSDWATQERDLLSHARHEVLTDAAEAAIELGRFREAIGFASLASRIDASAESPHRSLMRAHAELGEIGSALRVFEAYRARLAEELGADPSPQTTQLHLRLLRGHSR